MASLYPKEKSPFWYLRYRDPKSGRMVNRSTGMRRDDTRQTQEAKRMRAEREAKELAVPKIQSGEAWDTWVPAWLKVNYGASHLSHIRATAAWTALSTYLLAKGVRSPRLLQRVHCLEYVAWRAGPDSEGVKAGLREVVHNTALLELKFLSKIMREAVAREISTANPCLQLGIKRTPAKVKPEITDAEVTIIEAGLVAEKGKPDNDALRISWEIAMLQVCRLKETCVPLADVNLEERTITFRIKGGRDHTALLHPDLVPLFTKLKAEGGSHAFTMPANFAKKWFYFFRRHGLGHLSFHCTRVTGVTRLRRKGVDLRVAMEYVGHSSVLVHRIYQRQRRDDQAAATDALSRTPSS